MYSNILLVPSNLIFQCYYMYMIQDVCNMLLFYPPPPPPYGCTWGDYGLDT